MPLAVRFSTSFLVKANLLGGLLSSVLLLLAGRVSARSIGIAIFRSLCVYRQPHFPQRIDGQRVM